MRAKSWQCQRCGEPIGWLGRFIEWFFGPLHRCDDGAWCSVRTLNAGDRANPPGAWGTEGYIEQHEGFIPTGWRRAWNPLTNSSDAFELAVKLRITIRPEPHAVCAGWGEDGPFAPTIDGKGPWFWKEWLNDSPDVCTATRRAIVRAAAMAGLEPGGQQ